MTTRAAQRRARSQHSIDAPRLGYVSESTRMFGTNFDDSDDSLLSGSDPPVEKFRDVLKHSKGGTMESIVSGDGSSYADDSERVASGENTAQGVKKGNSNPFVKDTSTRSSASKNRVGPFDSGEQDFMVEDSEEGDEDEIDLVVEKWNGSNASDEKNLNLSGRGLLGMVADENENNDHSFGSHQEGYQSVPNSDNQGSFMVPLSGEEEPAAQEYNYGDEEDQDSPLFKAESIRLKKGSSAMTLSKNNPFADDPDDGSELMIETHKPRFGEMGDNGYASMEDLLNESKTSPFSSEKRKGIGGCMNKVFGPKKSKRRLITIVGTVLVFLGVIIGVVVVILTSEVKTKEAQLGAFPSQPQPSTSPSPPPMPVGPVGPSFTLPSFVLNGNATNSSASNLTVSPSLISGNASAPVATPTPYNNSMTPSLSSIASFKPYPTWNIPDWNNSLTIPTSQPSIITEGNSTMNETIIDANSTINTNDTIIDSNSTDGDIFNNETIYVNETESNNETIGMNESLVPTPTPFDMNASGTIMPSFMLNWTSNVTDINGTSNITDINGTFVPTPAPNSSGTIMPSILLNETDMEDDDMAFNETDTEYDDMVFNETDTQDDDMAVNQTSNETVIPTPSPSDMNASGTIMPSVPLNGTSNSTDMEDDDMPNGTLAPTPSAMNGSETIMPSLALNETLNETDVDMDDIFSNNETDVPTPAPFISISSETLMPSTIDGTQVPTMVEETAAPSPSETISYDFLDELSDPWVLFKSIEHDEPSAMFGTSLAMSTDPLLLVVGAKDAINEDGDASGAAYVYSIDGNGDSSLLQVIYGEGYDGEFGNSIALSEDGSRLVVGSRSEGNDQSGAVRIYSISDSTYEQLGDTIVGETEKGRSGWAVSISGDGNIVAIGAPKGGPEGGGSVLTYEYDGDNWVLFGSEVLGGANAAVGYSVSLNSDGSILAIGNPKAKNREGSSNAGKVATYSIENSEWSLMDEFFGASSEDVEGTSIALSPDGEWMVTGSKGKNGEFGNIESAGSCSLHRNPSGRRWRLSNTINGQFANERLGTWVSISRDTSAIACGGTAATLEGFGTVGVVRTLNRRSSEESAIWPRAQGAEDSAFGSSIAFSRIGLAVGAPDFSGGKGGNLAGAVEIFSLD